MRTPNDPGDEDQRQLTRWIDGYLSEAEAKKLLAAHPEWAAEKQAAASLGDSLRSAVSLDGQIPYADFFNHQVRRRVAEEETGEAVPAFRDGDESTMRFPLFQRLRWLAGVGFLLTLSAVVLLAMRQPADRSEVVSAYTPLSGATVSTAYEAGAQATVIRLEGIEPLPETAALVETGSRPDCHVVFCLHSAEIGCPVSLLADNDEPDEFPSTLLVQF